jgi:hypothetical protein
MKTYDVLSAVQHLATAMARAEQAVGAERCARVQQAALTDAVGGVAPLGLSAEQMARVAAHLEAEVLLDDLRRGSAAPAGACA